MQLTLGLLQGWQDIGAMIILSLLCFIWAGQTSLGFCLLTCTFISLISSGSGRTSNEFQPCSKPCPLGVSFRHITTMKSSKTNTFILLLAMTFFLSCLSKDKTKNGNYELELTATLGGIIYLDTTFTIYIATTLFNPTKDTLSFVTMTCSYEDIFLTDTSIFKVQSRYDCYSNYPTITDIPPREKLDQFIMVKPTKKDIEIIDNKLHIGMYLSTPKKENGFDSIIKQHENRQKAKIIWSNEIDLKRLYRRLYK
jgi:hypothetical protein